MPTLLLMRHAEAGPASAGQDDFDRALTERGREQAAGVGIRLAGRGIVPEVALVSSAARTRQTFDAVSAAFAGRTVDARFERELYGADPETILSLVRSDAGAAERVMVVAHNPGIGSLAMAMGGAENVTALRTFPPATLAVFAFSGPGWKPGDARLDAIVAP